MGEGGTWQGRGAVGATDPGNSAPTSSSKHRKKPEKSKPDATSGKSNMDILKELRLLGISSERGYKTSDIVDAISQCNGSTPMAVKILWAKDKEQSKQAQGTSDDWLKSLDKPKSARRSPEGGERDDEPKMFSRSGSDGAGKKENNRSGISWVRRRKGNLEDDKDGEQEDEQHGADEPVEQTIFTPGVGLHSRAQVESMVGNGAEHDAKPSGWKLFKRRSSLKEGQKPESGE